MQNVDAFLNEKKKQSKKFLDENEGQSIFTDLHFINPRSLFYSTQVSPSENIFSFLIANLFSDIGVVLFVHNLYSFAIIIGKQVCGEIHKKEKLSFTSNIPSLDVCIDGISLPQMPPSQLLQSRQTVPEKGS